MRVKYFQLRRDLICLVLNVLGWDNDSLLFLFLRDKQLALRFETIRTKVTKIKCEEKDAVISSWDAPHFFKRRVTYLKKLVNKAEVVKRNMTSRGVLGRSP